MKIEIKGGVCVASGKNWSYERVGDHSAFNQTGKVPSLRIIKTIIKLHLKMHDIGAKLIKNNLPYINNEFDGVLTLEKISYIKKAIAVNCCSRDGVYKKPKKYAEIIN